MGILGFGVSSIVTMSYYISGISSICKNKILAIYGAGQPATAFDGARGCSIALHTHSFILILKEAKSRRRRMITASCRNNYTIDEGGFCGGL